MPLKFGAQVLDKVTCARVCVVVEDRKGRTATGWGESPLSVAWLWPSTLPYDERERRLKAFTLRLAKALMAFAERGHPMELGASFQRLELGLMLEAESEENVGEPIPLLAGLGCLAALDMAVFDAFGNLHKRPVFEMLTKEWMRSDLAHFLEPSARFKGRWPGDFLRPKQVSLPVWHLVGGLDPIDPKELHGGEPQDGYPVLLRDWIRTDGLQCLKIKLRGNDAAWDYERTVRIGQIAIEEVCPWLTADFNCTVHDPAYVCEILDRLMIEHPRIYGMLLYIEQPFPYDLDEHAIDVRSVSARKPLFLDESAHDWHCVRRGQELGWTGVALKTCKTLTGALQSLCWAREHGMTLMVQDLTNPMLAAIPHVQLAAHAGTIMGVECNGMQFYPAASLPEAAVHPGVYQRRNGRLDLSTLTGSGFGYRVDEIVRQLPTAAKEIEN